MADFYDVHCTNCGKVLKADRMAVDIDRILNTHLEKMAGRNVSPIYREAQGLFHEIRIGMYFTRFDMARDDIMDGNGTIHMTCQYILDFIERRYKTEISFARDAESKEGKTNITESDDTLDPFDSLNVDDSASEMLDSEWNDDSDKLSPGVLDSLCLKMALYSEIDSSEEVKRNYIEKLIQFLVKEKEFVLLECDCKFFISRDDRVENEFVSGLQVTYFDNDIVGYNHMVCPDCGEQFFIDAGKYEEKIIVMLGSSRVGKTAYLAALVNELNPEYGQPRFLNITVKDTADKRYVFFKENILKQYAEGKKITKTDEKKEAVALFSLDMIINGRVVIFTFVDLPGEVFVPRNEKELEEGEASGRFIINHRKICSSANAFWFCIDPVQIDFRLRSINENKEADKVEQDMNMVLSNIENSLHMMGTGKNDVPTAIVITKSDLIDSTYKLFSGDRSAEQHCLVNNTQFFIDRFHTVAANVKQYMMAEQVRNITTKLNYMFEKKNYFAVAAYGIDIQEKEGNEKKDKKPYGIMLPFLWTLAAFAYLQPVKYEPKIQKSGGIFHKREELIDSYEAVGSEQLYMAD